jgi:hypothetical protein
MKEQLKKCNYLTEGPMLLQRRSHKKEKSSGWEKEMLRREYYKKLIAERNLKGLAALRHSTLKSHVEVCEVKAQGEAALLVTFKIYCEYSHSPPEGLSEFKEMIVQQWPEVRK